MIRFWWFPTKWRVLRYHYFWWRVSFPSLHCIKFRAIVGGVGVTGRVMTQWLKLLSIIRPSHWFIIATLCKIIKTSNIVWHQILPGSIYHQCRFLGISHRKMNFYILLIILHWLSEPKWLIGIHSLLQSLRHGILPHQGRKSIQSLSSLIWDAWVYIEGLRKWGCRHGSTHAKCVDLFIKAIRDFWILFWKVGDK